MVKPALAIRIRKRRLFIILNINENMPCDVYWAAFWAIERAKRLEKYGGRYAVIEFPSLFLHYRTG